MSKSAVMIPIQPKWCELIVNGKKTIEVRKTRPKLKPPFKCYIYCTAPRGKYLHRHKDHDKEWYIDREPFCDGKIYGGKVIGEFVCDKIKMEFGNGYLNGVMGYHGLLEGSCLDLDELMDYGKMKILYGWHISDLKIYDEPREITEFNQRCKEYYDGTARCDNCEYYYFEDNESYREEGCACEGMKPIKRPSQSWRYVEEV